MQTRRQFLGLAATTAVASWAAGCGWFPEGGNSAEGSAGKLLRSSLPLPEPFSVPLVVPPTLKPVRSDGTTDHYELTQRAGRVEIVPGTTTQVWGCDGRFPGPTLESRSGRRTAVRHHNELPGWPGSTSCTTTTRTSSASPPVSATSR